MKKFLVYLAITLGLVFGCYLIPALAQCPSPTGTNPSGCLMNFEAVDSITLIPLSGVTFSCPLPICTTGTSGKCSGIVPDGTRNYYATKTYYDQKICLLHACSKKTESWYVKMVYSGIQPTLFTEPEIFDGRVDYDRGQTGATQLILKFIVPASLGCTGESIPSYRVELGTYSITAAEGSIYIPADVRPYGKEGTIEGFFGPVYCQTPSRCVFRRIR